MPKIGGVSSGFWSHFNIRNGWTLPTNEDSKSQGVELSPANVPLPPTSGGVRRALLERTVVDSRG